MIDASTLEEGTHALQVSYSAGGLTASNTIMITGIFACLRSYICTFTCMYVGKSQSIILSFVSMTGCMYAWKIPIRATRAALVLLIKSANSG